MNDLIAKLYDQATVLEGNGDYVAGELDPVKFAELIVRECMSIADLPNNASGQWDHLLPSEVIGKHFGVEW